MNIFQYNRQRNDPRRCVAEWDLIEPDDSIDIVDSSGIEVHEYSTLGEFLKCLDRARKEQ